MKKKRYVIILQWTDIFGEENESEIPCINEDKMNKQIAQIKNQYKHDPWIAKFSVYGVVR